MVISPNRAYCFAAIRSCVCLAVRTPRSDLPLAGRSSRRASCKNRPPSRSPLEHWLARADDAIVFAEQPYAGTSLRYWFSDDSLSSVAHRSLDHAEGSQSSSFLSRLNQSRQAQSWSEQVSGWSYRATRCEAGAARGKQPHHAAAPGRGGCSRRPAQRGARDRRRRSGSSARAESVSVRRRSDRTDAPALRMWRTENGSVDASKWQ